MVALILAAGYGTRLYPLTKEVPKALLPVQEKPILEHLMEKLEAPELEIRQMVMVSNHRYFQPFQTWLARRPGKLRGKVLDDGSTSEENRLGSVGDMAFAIRAASLEKEDLLVLGSDNLFRDGLSGFGRFAQEKAPAVTLGAYELPDKSSARRYGVLALEEDRVSSFQEKPANPPSALISTAIYFFPCQSVHWVLEYVGLNQSADTLGCFIQWLLSRQAVFAYRFQGPWFDIGDMVSYTHAQETYAS